MNRMKLAILLMGCVLLIQTCHGQNMTGSNVNSLQITMPQVVDLWSGWRQEVPVKIENKNARDTSITLFAQTPENIFINGRTSQNGKENDSIEILHLNIPAKQTLKTSLELQSLRHGDYPVKIILGPNKTSMTIHSEPIKRGAYFMYRCWFEGSEFFYPIWSNGQEIIDGGGRKRKIAELAKNKINMGANRFEAERIAKEEIWREFPAAGYKKRPDWKKAFDRKKNQRTETYGFEFADIDGFGWDAVERPQGKYDWTIGDFVFDLARNYYAAEPFVRIEIPPQWTDYVKGPTGIWGFYDPQNRELMEGWEEYCAALADRYNGDGKNDAPGSPIINHFILMNEPEGYWLNVDLNSNGQPMPNDDITKTRWWQQAEEQGKDGGQAFAEKFGDLVFEVTRRAAEAIHRMNPNARVATPQFVAMIDRTARFMEYLLDKGLGKYVDAWGIHPGNSLGLLWQDNPDVAWWVEDAYNQAPPFDFAGLGSVKGNLDRHGRTLSTVRPLDQLKKDYPYLGKMWRQLIDESFSRHLEMLNRMFTEYGLDLPFWATEELTIGPLATNRRENLIAALRAYSIVFHQKMEITVLAGYIDANTFSGNTHVGYLPDSIAKGLVLDIARAIGGAKPIEKFDCRWFAQRPEAFLDYRWIVYKLFNRGDEDIIAIWSNSAKEETLAFTLNSNAQIRKFRVIEYDAETKTFGQEMDLKEFPKIIIVKPLKEFYFLSVTSNQSGFTWLSDLKRRASSEEQELIALYDKTVNDIEQAKKNLKHERDSNMMKKGKMVLDALIESESAMMTGDFDKARQNLNHIQEFLAKLEL